MLTLGALAAVFRDLPFRDVLLPTETTGWRVTFVVGVPLVAAVLLYFCGVTFGGFSPMAFAWPVGLAYIAWVIVTNLRGARG
jgi:hypothetical protein